jgi:hypothetical protein
VGLVALSARAVRLGRRRVLLGVAARAIALERSGVRVVTALALLVPDVGRLRLLRVTALAGLWTVAAAVRQISMTLLAARVAGSELERAPNLASVTAAAGRQIVRFEAEMVRPVTLEAAHPLGVKARFMARLAVTARARGDGLRVPSSSGVRIVAGRAERCAGGRRVVCAELGVASRARAARAGASSVGRVTAGAARVRGNATGRQRARLLGVAGLARGGRGEIVRLMTADAALVPVLEQRLLAHARR